MAGHVVPFGKHRGKPLAEIPATYLLWLLRACKLSHGLRRAVEGELVGRGLDPPGARQAEAEARYDPSRCDRCGVPQIVSYGWMEDCRGQRRIQRLCGCGRALGFAPHVEPWVSLANASASPTAALDVLTECEELGIELLSDGRAAYVGRGWQLVSPSLRQRLAQCRHSLARMMGQRRAT